MRYGLATLFPSVSDFQSSITRARFEDLCGDYFRATMGPVDKVLKVDPPQHTARGWLLLLLDSLDPLDLRSGGTVGLKRHQRASRNDLHRIRREQRDSTHS